MRFFRVIGALWLAIVGALVLTTSGRAATNMSFGMTIGPTLPSAATVVKVKRDVYFVYNGSFYRQLKVGYVLVPAPIGATINHLPRGAVKFTVGKAVYFQHAGVYYKLAGRRFQVCDAPATAAETGTPASEIAEVPVEVGDDVFVFRKGRFFVQSPDGLLGRSIPLGGIAREFPPDAMSVWFRDHEYFESGGVFFQEVVGGFKVVSPPWQKTAVVTSDSLAHAN